jgi:hypothetical protein
MRNPCGGSAQFVKRNWLEAVSPENNAAQYGIGYVNRAPVNQPKARQGLRIAPKPASLEKGMHSARTMGTSRCAARETEGFRGNSGS